MKGTDNFKLAIEEHLQYRAFRDPLFAKTLEKKNKNINDCIKYILGVVKDSGSNGFSDKEVFDMAEHYYNEDDIKIEKGNDKMQVVINHKVQLTDKEIADAKQKAIDDIISEQRDKMLNKPKKKTTTVIKSTEEKASDSCTLF